MDLLSPCGDVEAVKQLMADLLKVETIVHSCLLMLQEELLYFKI